MAQQSQNEDVVTVRLQKHSMWTQFKIVTFWNFMVLLGVGFAWVIVNTNVAIATASGFVGKLCSYCGDLLIN